jgi:hypothetical protein
VQRQLSRTQQELGQLPGTLTLRIGFTVQGTPLQLGTTYATKLGELRFQGVRYWLSQLRLITEQGESVDVPDSYYLMEVRGEEPLRGNTQNPVTLPARRRENIQLPSLPSGRYRAISFNVGVDAAHNDDLSLSAGELTVLQNMASYQWMWFTSYIFTQLNAAVSADHDLVQLVQEDGGVPADLQVHWENGSNQDLRRVELALPSQVSVGVNVHPLVDVQLDVVQLFVGLDAQLAAARSSSPSSPYSAIGATDEASRKQLADNWSRAFRAASVSYGSP